jgi:hypothetical protein
MPADFVPLAPATYGDTYSRKPPLNGGSPKKPDPPPPAPAPVRADDGDPENDASRIAARKKGLRRTMLQEMLSGQEQGSGKLGAKSVLGTYASGQ